ncbi:ABC transporter permease [Clostridium sp. MCC353]|uniref:ABC transporter permease n=1 Tax=Clostridium sp. MCC353 TaxID=2592646 RepID=UPI001C015ECD|nr:ABC transporter permease [Clostridium sp. MCC353]MBT9775033.1 ABC transporter permease [Clostridium sp. MCC353]
MNTLTILRRSIKWRLYNPATILATIIQPLIWLVLYSTTAGQSMSAAGIGHYPSFILPGLMVLVCFGVCSSTGIMNYLTRRDGSFYRILTAPVSRTSIAAGQILEAVLCSFLEVCIMCGLSLLLSARFSFGAGELVLAVLILFLASFFMAGLAYTASLFLPNEVMYETVMNGVVLPVFFLSTALFPADMVSKKLAVIIRLNPFTHVINGLRSLIITGGAEPGYLLFILFMLLCLDIFILFCARWRLERAEGL